ncbi:MAG TPA: enoyl-CoA hydratase [Candidatus Acidoferrales bacterium]|nr:enoyl-CoA hydratase [Candidatus Acidoferrales bacterium]
MAETATSTAPVLVETRDAGVLTLHMNRPERLNALDPELAQALATAVERAGSDPTVRAMILTGAGRAFCAGGDLGVIRALRDAGRTGELEPLLRAGTQLILGLRTISKPVIAAVNGPAAGAGMNVALACDYRIASEQATFGQNFAKVGLFPDFGGTYLLPRLAGESRAAWMFYTGDMITAQEALRIGVVDRLAPPERVMPEAQALAAQFAAGPPMVLGAVKNVLFGPEKAKLERALELEAEQQMRCFWSEDCTEGIRAFFEKRAPKFQGK